MKYKLSEYKILKYKSNRIKLPESERAQLIRLEKGGKGEEKAAEFLQKFGHPDWVILRNMRFDRDSPYEIDILVIGRIGWWGLEVKNYEGDFTYTNGNCYYNEIQMTRDIIAQTKRIQLKNRQIIQRLQLSNNVRTSLVFINEHHTVLLDEQPHGIDIIKRNEFKKCIEEMERIENNSYWNIPLNEQLEKIFESEIGAYKNLPVIDDQSFNEMKRGFYCPECLNFNLKGTQRTLVCSCGHQELTVNALERTIEEYSILFHNKNIAMSEVLHFLDYRVSRATVYRILMKNYKAVGKTKGRIYLNPYKQQKMPRQEV